MKNIIYLIVILFMFEKCKTVKPVFPDIPTDSLPRIAPPPSQIAIPAQVDFTAYLADIDNTVNGFFPINGSGGDACGEPQYQFTVVKDRSVPVDLALSPANAASPCLLNIGATLGVGAGASVCPLCVHLWGTHCVGRLGASCGINGESPRRVSFSLSTPFDIGPDYHLSSPNIQLSNLHFLDDCKVTFLNINITGPIENIARQRLPSFLQNLNGPISSVSVAPFATSAWQRLSDTIKLGNGLYLFLHPTGLSKGPLNGNGHILNLTLGVDAMPEITTQLQTPLPVVALPALGQSQPDPGFNIYAAINLDYNFLNGQLNNALKGQSINVLDKTLNITKVQLYPTKFRRVIIEVDFKGSERGCIFLIGTPSYRASDRTIFFKDMVYDLKTSNILINALAWIAQPFVINSIKDKAKFDIGSVLDGRVASLNATINAATDPHVSLTGTRIDGINIVDNNFTFQPKQLEILAHAKGVINVSIR